MKKNRQKMTSYGNPSAEIVIRTDARNFISRLSRDERENIFTSLKNIKAEALDVYTHNGDSYLVSRVTDGAFKNSFTTHYITKSGLEWGNYNIPSRWKAQKQAMTRVSGVPFEKIELIEEKPYEALQQEIGREKTARNIYVADKNKKIALCFIPDVENGSGITVVCENSITGIRFSDASFKAPSDENVCLDSDYIEKFVEKTADKHGLKKENIEHISKDEFEKIKEKTESVIPVAEQSSVERFLRQSQDMLFRYGIESSSRNVDKILSLSYKILKTFNEKEKKQLKDFFENFEGLERNKSLNAQAALAYFIADSDVNDVLKKYPIFSRKNEHKMSKASEKNLEYDVSR